MDRKKTIACLIALCVAGCARSPRIVVGSKNFTEQLILGELIAQHLERRVGVRVDRKLNLGGTLLAHEALRTGEIDVYPEYTGTALTAILKMRPDSDSSATFTKLQSEYRARWQLAWLSPLGFNNTFAMVVRSADAKAGGLTSLSDAARSRSNWKMGAGYEFLQRPDGLAGLLKTYGLQIQGSPTTMDLGLLYQALQNKQVDMVAANSTDGQLSVLDVTVLADDKTYFPPYECAAVVREQTLAAYPALRGALEELSGKITDAAMRKMNHQVTAERRPVREIAAEFLGMATDERR
jgi:osmoprotectant transport system substrate-binding protein